MGDKELSIDEIKSRITAFIRRNKGEDSGFTCFYTNKYCFHTSKESI